MSFLSSIAPTIATALAGPLAGAAVEFIADKLGVSNATKETIANTVQGLDPLKAKELDIQYKEFLATNGIQIQLSQIAVNTEEAKSTNWFVAGWRPFIGWTCGAAFAINFVFGPLGVYAAILFFGKAIILPTLDLATMMPVLFGMLGLGAYRTYEKVNNVAENR